MMHRKLQGFALRMSRQILAFGGHILIGYVCAYKIKGL